jgi:hypothetical protein
MRATAAPDHATTFAAASTYYYATARAGPD